MRRILVGLDGSPLAESILPFVEAVARKMGAKVTLLHVSAIPEGIPPIADHPAIDQIVRRDRELAAEYLQQQQRRLAGAGVETSIATAAGRPAAEIVACATREAADLVALATHGRSGLQRWAYGSVADAVLHTTATPLLLMRPDAPWTARPHGPGRILVALDGSPEAERALGVAEPLASRCRLPVVLVRYVEPLVLAFTADPGGMAYLDVRGILDASIQGARDYLEAHVAALYQCGIGASAEVSVAAPASGIRAYVAAHPDTLLVLCTHGRSGWKRALLGSVARRVLETVAAPMILCPPPAARSAA
jgi:nucleotide-binding universal stress UspA family protein